MPTHRVEPFADYIIVLDMERKMTIDGIELPENMKQQDMVFGRVISTGIGCLHIHADETIAYGPYAGKIIAFDGVPLRIMREGMAEARIVANG